MIGVNVRVLSNRLPTYAAGLEGRLGPIVAKAAHDVEGRYKATVPVDTGNLKNSIGAKAERPTRWLVTAGADYAGYVEYGTRFAPARPAAVPAALGVWPSFQAAVAAALREV